MKSRLHEWGKTIPTTTMDREFTPIIERKDRRSTQNQFWRPNTLQIA
jgi:hypothetical protein